MVPPVGSAAPLFHFIIEETPIYRRKLQAEFLAIENVFLDNISMVDSLSIRVKALHQTLKAELLRIRNTFSGRALENEERSFYIHYMELMDESLKDPFLFPLDPEAVLGSDGVTYNSKALIMWLSLDKPEIYKERSPLYPENPATLIVTPHPIAHHMVSWLQNYVSPGYLNPILEGLQQDYDILSSQGNLPRLPTPQYVQMRELFKAREAARRASAAQRQEQQRKMEEEFKKDEESIKKEAEDLRAEAEKKRTKLDAEREAEIAAAAARDAKARADFAQKAEGVKAKVFAAEKKVAELSPELADIEAQTAKVQKGTEQNRQTFAEVRQTLHKQDRDDAKQVLKSIAIIGACAAASYMMGPYLPAKVGLLPGGSGLKFAIPF